MNTIHPPQKGDRGKEQPLPEGIQENIPPHQHEVNLMEGSEFLDDAIRMKDQPLEETSAKEDE